MRFSSRTLPICLGAFFLALLSDSALLAQEGQKVRFYTGDGVEIHGMFYTSAKRSAPCAILLHSLGEDSSKKGWKELAESLQKKGFAVLTFDFRGHGNSQGLNDSAKFWAQAYNRNYVKAAPNSDTIEFKNFSKAYYPALANDLAAARAYLDRQNDAGACNTASLILVGANTGATVGALWLESEWNRYKATVPQGVFLPQMQPGTLVSPLIPLRPENKACGKDIIAAVWLSINPMLGTTRVNLSSLLSTAAKKNYTPMTFLYGDEDAQGKTTATTCAKYIKPAKGPEAAKQEYTGAVAIPGTGKSIGRELLNAKGTAKAIVDWAELVSKEKANEWEERDFQRAIYLWISATQPARRVLANNPGDKSLAFNTYLQFVK